MTHFKSLIESLLVQTSDYIKTHSKLDTHQLRDVQNKIILEWEKECEDRLIKDYKKGSDV